LKLKKVTKFDVVWVLDNDTEWLLMKLKLLENYYLNEKSHSDSWIRLKKISMVSLDAASICSFKELPDVDPREQYITSLHK